MRDYRAHLDPVATARPCGVLVADDEPDICSVLETGLPQEGFCVWTAGDGLEALRLYRAHRESVDVVLLDVQMPRLDGPRTLAAMREFTRPAPCCFMSGHLGGYSEAELHALGARALVKKPFELAELAQILRAVAWGAEAQPVVAAPALRVVGRISGFVRSGVICGLTRAVHGLGMTGSRPHPGPRLAAKRETRPGVCACVKSGCDEVASRVVKVSAFRNGRSERRWPGRSVQGPRRA